MGKVGAMTPLLRFGLITAATLGLGTVAFVGWALDATPPDPAAYAAATADVSVVIGSKDGFIMIRPAASEPSVGLLFYPGARVAPAAYVAKLSAVAAGAKVQVVIGRPTLNLAVFSIGQADAMRAVLPGVTRWYVGGHSLGGAMACLYASKHRRWVEGVVLMGTYCGTDISDSSLRVLSITGERDGLFPPSKIAAARRELPSGARLIQVRGMNHAQFGNYGAQPGDQSAIIGDARARESLVRALAAFFSEPPGRGNL
jgi:Alpha/beta hydrolase family